ncbi:MAG: arylsulfatase [Acidimicrobiia bacterium]
MEPGAFGGEIGRYHWESTPWWPAPSAPPAGAPNVLFVVLDDVGFAQLGCFGSDIDTPAMDGLAANGLRYSNFHTTALCSPTRSCLLTGRNHHSNGMGRITDLATGFHGYDARIPRANGFLSEMLVDQGYAAWAVGKWHLVPEEETNLGAPRSRWPLGRGFERFYGFHGGETHQFAPWLVHDNHFVDQPRSIAEGYHLTEDLVDHAITYVHDLRAVEPDKRFFLYFATGACHSPHQAPAQWMERYRGRFDAGWDVAREEILGRQLAMGLLPEGTELSLRPEWVPAWESLGADEQRLYARYMEAFAAFLSHTDSQLGRLLAALEETGDLDDTLVMLVSDNGASSEGGETGSVNDVRPWNMVGRPLDEAIARIDEIGGPRLHNNYPWGWTVAGNTPFRRWKREVHEGGVADPLIVHWANGIAAKGEIRHQYVHAIDLLPSVLDVLRVEAPTTINEVEQVPIEGVSFAPTFDAPDAPSARTTQYFEMFGCRALYHEGWKAVAYHPIHMAEPGLDRVDWELYNVVDDPSECHDLAAVEPERLDAMIDRWWQEAEAHQVLPVDNRPFSEFTLERPEPAAVSASRVVYYPDGGMVPEESVIALHDRSHSITAEVVVPDAGADGVLLSLGNLQGGFSFFVQAGRLAYVHNYVGKRWTRIDSTEPIAPGSHALSFRFERVEAHQGIATLSIDGVEVGRGEIRRFTPVRWNMVGAGLYCGIDPGLAVCDDYEAPFPFAGDLRRVVVEASGEQAADPKARSDIAIARQ